MSGLPQSVPTVPTVPLVDGKGIATPIWYQFFIALLQRTGGSSGNPSLVLDAISSTVGAILTRATGGWIGLAPGAQYKVLRMGAGSPEWDTLDGNSFPSEGANVFFAGPSSGPAVVPSFRQIASADLVPVAGLLPGVVGGGGATAGNVGEFVSASVASGSAIALTTATPTDIASIALTPGDWDVWANVGLIPASGASVTAISAWINSASATDPGSPNGGAYVTETPLAGLTGAQTAPVGMKAVQLGSGTTLYLSCNAAYTGGTLGAYGFIGARRRR